MSMIEIKHVAKSFEISKGHFLGRKSNKVQAVDDISLAIRKGEAFALLGPNGAGKTTTLRMIAGLIKPDRGDIILDGCSVVTNAPMSRRKVGFLTNDLKLDGFFTPNYLFDYFSKLYDIPKQVSQSRKSKLFQQFDIAGFADVKIAKLSMGMRQKVSLVISLLHDPQIVIYDEPTNGLDIIAAKVVVDQLKTLKSDGKTIILSTHILELLEGLCDSIGIINQTGPSSEENIAKYHYRFYC